MTEKKLQIISDVHTECGMSVEKFASLLKTADVTVLAGDIVNRASKLAPFLKECKKISTFVIFVCGNHEYYRKSVDQDYAEICKQEDVVFLQRNRIKVDGIWFCGATLWSNVSDAVHEMMNDPFKGKKIREMHAIDKKWLQENVEKADVVITHHLPSLQLIDEKYSDSPLICAFASNLENLLKELQPTAWICGHTHKKFDIVLENVRIIANPVGYANENSNFETKIISLNNFFHE